jgi:hypothetical protein
METNKTFVGDANKPMKASDFKHFVGPFTVKSVLTVPLPLTAILCGQSVFGPLQHIPY